MPGTTPGGLPYPLPTEPVAAGADAIKNLALAANPAIQVRKWAVTRAAVPTGQTLYELVQGAENTADRTPTYPTITYSGVDFSWVLTDPGWYDIFLTTYLDWGNAGTGGRIQIVLGTDHTALPTAISYFGAAAAQVASLTIAGVRSDGTRKLFLQGYHNSGTTLNFQGQVTFVKTRGI